MKPAAIDNELWDGLYKVYVEDTHDLDMEAYFRDKNPYALQEMTAVMLETARKGYWETSDENLDRLARLHAELVRDHDAGCSGFVCDNAKLRDVIGERLPEDLRQAYDTAIDDLRVGNATNQVQGMTLEKQPDPVARAAELVRDNPAMVAVLLALVAVVIGVVAWGARRAAG